MSEVSFLQPTRNSKGSEDSIEVSTNPARPDQPRSTTRRTDRTAADLFEDLRTVLEQLTQLPAQFSRVMTYSDMIEWFVRERPPGDLARRGAVLRTERRGARVEIMQVFLDAHGEPLRTVRDQLVSRHVIVNGLDPELEASFGAEDLIIVE